MKTLYQVKNIVTGQLVGNPKSLRAASNHCDRLDLAYGAICSIKIPVSVQGE